MIIDAFEIYGHDPTDKLDNLWLYQNEMMKIKTAEDQVINKKDPRHNNMLTKLWHRKLKAYRYRIFFLNIKN